MNEKHTRGPWHFTDHMSHDKRLIYGPDGCLVADAGRIPRRSSEEMTANALLIAAAPDMLAACSQALNALENVDSSVGLLGGEAAALRQLRAVLIKAVPNEPRATQGRDKADSA